MEGRRVREEEVDADVELGLDEEIDGAVMEDEGMVREGVAMVVDVVVFIFGLLIFGCGFDASSDGDDC